MKYNIYKRKELNKGITLIALVITIIVLLILAGITINTIINNNNAMEKASEAKIKTELAEIDEKIKFAVMEINTKYYTQTEEREKSSYYESKETFIEEGKFDSKNYNIKIYNKDRIDVGIIELKDVSKNNGTGTEYTFEIDIGDNMVICTSHKMSENTGNTGGKGDNQDHPVQTGRIFYETNGGRFEDENSVRYEYTTSQIINFSIPVKDNFAFDGWYLNSDFSGNKMYSTTEETTGDITLYAKWIEESSTAYFTYNGDKNTITGFSDAGVEAFKNGQIKEIIFPKQNEGVVLTAIGTSAFSANNSKISGKGMVIEKIVIPDSVTSLSNNSFTNLTSLKDITLPISLNVVVNSNPNTTAAFYGVTGITNVRLTKGTGEGINYSGATGSYENKCFYTPWYLSRENDIQLTIDEGITSIGECTFYQCTGLKNISIPNSVTTIGRWAFYQCSSMSGELTTIGNVTTIGKSAFCGCSSITGTLAIPSGITKLDQYVFYGTGITKLIIHDNVTQLDVNTFRECTSLTDITLPISLNTVVNSNPNTNAAFYGTNKITKVKFTKGTGEGTNYSTATGSYANKCYYTPWYLSRNNTITIEIDSGITSIGNYTLYELNNATVYYNGTQTEWNSVSYNSSSNPQLSNIQFH